MPAPAASPPAIVRAEPEITFHRSVYLPVAVRLPAGEVELIPTTHAEGAAAQDGTGLPTRLNFDGVNIIEVSTDSRLRVTKLLCRVPWDSRGDLCVVLRPTATKSQWKIVTVWINRHDDHHRTLDRSRYIPTP